MEMARYQKLCKIPAWIWNNRYFILNRFRFNHVGKRVCVFNPLKINGHKNIYLGNNVAVHDGTWLAAVPLTGNVVKLVLEDNVTIGHFNHIYATRSIIIEKSVLTADKVYISDNLHSYEDTSLPIMNQPIKQCKDVVIGEGSWIGENVCIIGASIGKHCVIGANAVVTRDVPDFSVAIGAPAKVIKRYNSVSRQWDTV